MGNAFSNAINYGYSPSWCTGEVLLYNLSPSVITQSCPNLWHNTEISSQPKGSGANITLGVPLKVQIDLGDDQEGDVPHCFFSCRPDSPIGSPPSSWIFLLIQSLIPKFLHSIDFNGVSAVGQGLVSALGVQLWRKHNLPSQDCQSSREEGHHDELQLSIR